MKALILSDIAKLELREIPSPEVSAHNVLLRILAVGICGTDFHIFSGHTNFNLDKQRKPIPLKQQPQILGHEIVGIVEEVGTKVKDLKIGDRVVVDQGLNCWSQIKQILCEYCATGDTHQCEFYGEHGITGIPGGFAEYFIIPAVNAVKIESNLDSVEAAITEPLGCIAHALNRAENSHKRYTLNPQKKEQSIRSILVFGAGPAGLIFIQYLRNVLGYKGLLLVSEPNPKKRELAESFGAESINPEEIDLVATIQEKTQGRGVEYVIDACGAGAVFSSIAEIIRKQGTILLYGFGHGGVDLSVLNHLQFKEVTLVCSTGASGKFDQDKRPLTDRKSLNLIESGKIKVNSWITHRYQSLKDIPQSFITDRHSPDYIKGVFRAD